MEHCRPSNSCEYKLGGRRTADLQLGSGFRRRSDRLKAITLGASVKLTECPPVRKVDRELGGVKYPWYWKSYTVGLTK